MAFLDTPAQIYNRMWETLYDDDNDQPQSDFAFFETLQRNFFASINQSLPPHLFPWGFLEYGSSSEISTFRMPNVWQYDWTVPFVIMNLSGTREPDELTDMVFSSDNDAGIGYMAQKTISVFWNQWKQNHFGIDGVRDWWIQRVGDPSVRTIRGLNHPLLRILQIDFRFQIKESGF